MRYLSILTLIICTVSSLSVNAARLDSLLNLPAIGIPVVSYAPETSWGFGLAAQGYVKLPEQQKTSVFQLDGLYTLNKQWYVNASGNVYIGGENPWQLHFRVGYKDYPYRFYGQGNEVTYSNSIPYRSKRGTINVQTVVQLPYHWGLGPALDCLLERNDIQIGEVAGAGQVSLIGAGLITQHDNRDITYYPTKGLFFKCQLLYYGAYSEDRCHFGYIDADLRHYIPIKKDVVFAWQFKGTCLLSAPHIQIPFQIKPTLGGGDLLRGVKGGVFRDDLMLALQSELRFPIWSVLKACVFAGIGDVYNWNKWHWTTPKVGYGMGLRLCINKAKINIRFDVARSNIVKAWDTIDGYSFYLTATEAF